MLVSALALLTLVAQDVVSWIEEHRGGQGELHHLFIFDLAWPVFLLSTLLTLIAGVVALVCGRLRASTRLTRYAWWAPRYVAGTVLAVVLAVSLGLVA